MQRLSWDIAHAAKLQEEVTQVATIMAKALATRAERKARESATLLDSARGEADEVARKATLLGGEVVVA
jgi:hypothetical protein